MLYAETETSALSAVCRATCLGSETVIVFVLLYFRVSNTTDKRKDNGTQTSRHSMLRRHSRLCCAPERKAPELTRHITVTITELIG